MDTEFPLHRLAQAVLVPQILHALRRDELGHGRGDDLRAHRLDFHRDVLGFHELAAAPVDHLALIVGHVIVFQEVLAGVEVMGFDLALGAFDLPRQQLALDDLARSHPGAGEQPLGAFRVTEDSHQVVFHREVEAARPGIALAARTPAQLVVDAP